MRNLWIFIRKYNAFFLFVIFEIAALIIYIQYNSFQRASYINASNEVTGNLYKQVSRIYSYLSLSETNDSLAAENARLRNQLKSSFYVDSLAKRSVKDTVFKQQYTYLMARVVSNSINKRSNYITIDKGNLDGVTKGMGVICNEGIVGKVINTSPHFSTVQSMLHKESLVSAILADTKETGRVRWGDDMDPTKGILFDVQNLAKPRLNELVVTSRYSLWPEGIPIGKIISLSSKAGGELLNMDIRFSVNYGRLEYVNVVINKMAQEQTGLEAQQKKDE
jgi:rod shape-determining protein MreC